MGETPEIFRNSIVDNSAKFSVLNTPKEDEILPVVIVLIVSNSLPIEGFEGIPLWVQKLVNILLSPIYVDVFL